MSYIDITQAIGKAVDTSQPEFWKKRNEKVLTILKKNLTDAEQQFADILDEYNIPYFVEITVDTFTNAKGNCYRYDFGVMKITDDGRILLLCIVEIDGSGHTMRPDWKENDAAKEDICRQHGFPFNRIHYMELTLNKWLIKNYIKEAYDQNNFYDIKTIPNYIQFSNEIITLPPRS